MLLSMAQVASAIVPCPQAVEKPALWKKRTPRSPSSSSGAVTKQPYMSACPLGSKTSKRLTRSRFSIAQDRLSSTDAPGIGPTPPLTMRNGSPAVW